MLILFSLSQNVDGRRLDDHEACKRYLVAERHSQRHEAPEGMADEVDAAAGSANNRLHYFGVA